tara:strand:- start:156 stop:659 length:504 start_codon:yes stop_codon:yes gene_type:complete
MSLIFKYWAKIILILCIIAISSALVAEYIFNIYPCDMCLYQRYPYYFIVTIFIIFSFSKKNFNLYFYLLSELAILYGLFYSVWHVGIENKLFDGPSGCSTILEKTNSTADLKNQILSQDIVICSEVTWAFFGISAATINTILLLFIFFFNTIYIINNYYEKKEKNKT